MSPTFLNYNGLRFFTWSKEEERRHIHVVGGNKQCKVWLEPTIAIAENCGFKEYELNEIIRIVSSHETEFKCKWDKFFG